MNLCKYVSFFHDGFVHDIQARNDYIQFTLESSQIEPVEIEDINLLSNTGSLVGNLCLEGIISLEFEPGAEQSFDRLGSTNSIISLDIGDNTVRLAMVWENCEDSETDLPMICTVKARRVYWENMPKYFDPHYPPIENYTKYFTGGKLSQIEIEDETNLLLVMESATVKTQDIVWGYYSPTERNTLQGTLELLWVQEVRCDGEAVPMDLVELRGITKTIDQMSLANHWLSLELSWNRHSSQGFSESSETRIEIYAGAIDWRDGII